MQEDYVLMPQDKPQEEEIQVEKQLLTLYKELLIQLL